MATEQQQQLVDIPVAPVPPVRDGAIFILAKLAARVPSRALDLAPMRRTVDPHLGLLDRATATPIAAPAASAALNFEPRTPPPRQIIGTGENIDAFAATAAHAAAVLVQQRLSEAFSLLSLLTVPRAQRLHALLLLVDGEAKDAQ